MPEKLRGAPVRRPATPISVMGRYAGYRSDGYDEVQPEIHPLLSFYRAVRIVIAVRAERILYDRLYSHSERQLDMRGSAEDEIVFLVRRQQSGAFRKAVRGGDISSKVGANAFPVDLDADAVVATWKWREKSDTEKRICLDRRRPIGRNAHTRKQLQSHRRAVVRIPATVCAPHDFIGLDDEAVRSLYDT